MEQLPADVKHKFLSIVLKNNGLALQYLKEQTPELCLEAVLQILLH